MVTPSVRLLRPLGAGGMGAVWVAEHLGLKTKVVVKFIAPELAHKPEAAARFEREAAAAAHVKSPHVVQVLDHGASQDHGPYIVMELLEGQDLATYLKANGPLPAREVAAMIGQVARALAKAHAASIIHRDIKPDNIFLCDADGGEVFVKLLDFGVAKADDRIGTGTTTGQVMGTPYYMSPEQLLGEPIDPRTDIWALGVVAFEAMTGQRPFRGETIGALTLAIHSPLPRAAAIAANVPTEFDAWFQRVCAQKRDDRFATARDAAQALYDVCEGAAAEPKRLFSARPPMLSLDLTSSPSLSDASDRPKTDLSSTAGVPSERRDRRRPGLVVLGVGLLVVIGAAALFAGKGKPSDRATVATGAPQEPATMAAPPPSAMPSTGPSPTTTTRPEPSVIASGAPAMAPASARPVQLVSPAPHSSVRSTPRPTRPKDGFDDIK
jgi:serine/threonine-protein kinase